MPGLTLEGDVHVGGTLKVAWFKDPDGTFTQSWVDDPGGEGFFTATHLTLTNTEEIR